jgi:hypothetical protein
MSQLVKTKRQTNFKYFKRFGAFKGFVEQKNVVFNSWAFKTLVIFYLRVLKLFFKFKLLIYYFQNIKMCNGIIS